MTSVLIVDDHELVSAALAGALRSHDLEARWVAPAALHDELSQTSDGLVLLDLDLGVDREGTPMDGTTLIPTLRRGGWRVLILTAARDEAHIAPAIAAGAVGWVNKSSPFEQLIHTVLLAARGQPILDEGERSRLGALAAGAARQDAALHERWARLTAREREVLDRLVAGKRASGIAAEFVVSLATVRTQIRSILAKLEVGSQLEAVALAKQRGRGP